MQETTRNDAPEPPHSAGQPPQPAPILAAIIAARGHNRVPGEPRKRRVVARFSKTDIGRLDALRAQLPRTSRAQLLRAFAYYVLTVVEQASIPPATGSTP